MKVKTIIILGSKWRIKYLDKPIEGKAGTTDWTSRTIRISPKSETWELDSFKRYKKVVIRHEVIHAFLFESGLGDEAEYVEKGHDEQYIDWLAYMWPKIQKVFNKLGV